MIISEMSTTELKAIAKEIEIELQARKAKKKSAKKVAKPIDPYKEQVKSIRNIAKEVGKKFGQEPSIFRDKRKEGCRLKIQFYLLSKKESEKALTAIQKKVNQLPVLPNLVKESRQEEKQMTKFYRTPAYLSYYFI